MEMQRDAEIPDRYVIQAIQAVSRGDTVWKLSNRSRPEEGDLERLCAGVKQINGIDDDKYWSKHSPWMQPKYYRDKRLHKNLQKAERHFASCFAFSFAWAIEFWASISKWDASMSKIIIASLAN